MNPLVTLLALGLFLLANAVPSLAADAPNLVGTWEYKDPASGVTLTFLLNPDGSGKFADQPIRYTVEGDKLQLVADGEKITYNFKLDADTMTVSGGDLDKPAAFMRKGGAPGKKGLGAKLKGLGEGEPAKTDSDRPNPLAPGLGGADAKTTPAAADAKTPAAAGPVGVWQAEDGDQLEIRADALVYRGITIPATLTANAVKLSVNGQTGECPFEVSGNTMKITIGNVPMTLKRVGGEPEKKPADGAKAGAADPKPVDPKSIVGNWDSPDGSVIVRPDGTLRSGGKEVKYTLDEKFITLTDDTGWLKIPYKLDGDKLILGTGPTKTLTRAAAGPAGAAAGVWSVTESSVDPANVMSITQYLTLYPDGTVGFAKTEGGATRTAVSEQLERFSSFKNKAGGGGRTYGRWQADNNGNVTLQWQGAFGNATWQGRMDRNGKLVFPNAGILNEGSAQAYEKQ
jgi:hypothetical protein